MGESLPILPILSQLIPIVAILCLIGIPMTGLVMRYALAPLVRELAQALRAGEGAGGEEIGERMARIEQRLEHQEQAIRRLAEEERFHRELRSGRRADEAGGS